MKPRPPKNNITSKAFHCGRLRRKLMLCCYGYDESTGRITNDSLLLDWQIIAYALGDLFRPQTKITFKQKEIYGPFFKSFREDALAFLSEELPFYDRLELERDYVMREVKKAVYMFDNMPSKSVLKAGLREIKKQDEVEAKKVKADNARYYEFIRYSNENDNISKRFIVSEKAEKEFNKRRVENA